MKNIALAAVTVMAFAVTLAAGAFIGQQGVNAQAGQSCTGILTTQSPDASGPTPWEIASNTAPTTQTIADASTLFVSVTCR